MNNIGRSRVRVAGTARGGKRAGAAWPHGDTAPNPNDLIDTIVDALDYAELAKDAQGLIKARRLLNNDLRQAIDVYIQGEVIRAIQKRRVVSP
jgi:HD superfamily phosphohydrolase YqeK